MSEQIKLPFMDPKKSSFDVVDNHLIGSGELYSSFTFVNITDERFFSDLKSRGWQILASNMPLNGGVYGIMFVKVDNRIPNTGTQGMMIQPEGDFDVYYKTCRKPLILGNISRSYVLPTVTKFQALRFDNANKLPLQSNVQSTFLDYSQMARTLTLSECEIVLQHFLNQGGLSMWFIISDTYNKFGFTRASIIKNLITDDTKYVKFEELEETIPCFVEIWQGGVKSTINQLATHKLRVDDKDYYLGPVDY